MNFKLSQKEGGKRQINGGPPDAVQDREAPRDISIEQFCMNNNVKNYFVNFFESIASGRTDYQNLLPTTIGLKQSFNQKYF